MLSVICCNKTSPHQFGGVFKHHLQIIAVPVVIHEMENTRKWTGLIIRLSSKMFHAKVQHFLLDYWPTGQILVLYPSVIFLHANAPIMRISSSSFTYSRTVNKSVIANFALTCIFTFNVVWDIRLVVNYIHIITYPIKKKSMGVKMRSKH